LQVKLNAKIYKDTIYKYARINTCKVSREQVFRKLQRLGINADLEKSASHDPECIVSDKDFDGLLVIPPKLYQDVCQSELIPKGWIVLQDKVSFIGPFQAVDTLTFEEDHTVLDTRAGNGTRVSTLASLMHNRGKIYAVEDRDGRLAAMQKRFQLYNVQSKDYESRLDRC
jgi:16S rRNA C967 or C1407 C5-methylase (RsmB/RsmF family)